MKAMFYTAALAASLAFCGAASAQISSAPGATIPGKDSLAAGTYGVQGSTSNVDNPNMTGQPPKPVQKVRRKRASAPNPAPGTGDSSASGSASTY